MDGVITKQQLAISKGDDRAFREGTARLMSNSFRCTMAQFSRIVPINMTSLTESEELAISEPRNGALTGNLRVSLGTNNDTMGLWYLGTKVHNGPGENCQAFIDILVTVVSDPGYPQESAR